MRLILAIALAATAAVASAGEVYKWVDKDGKVHYGDKPKTGGEFIDVKPASGPGPSQEQVSAGAARAADCERLKAEHERYSKATTLEEKDGLGRTRQYTAEERAQFLGRLEKQRDDACKPAS